MQRVRMLGTCQVLRQWRQCALPTSLQASWACLASPLTTCHTIPLASFSQEKAEEEERAAAEKKAAEQQTKSETLSAAEDKVGAARVARATCGWRAAVNADQNDRPWRRRV